MRTRYIVSIRKFPDRNVYDLPCFIGQKTYRSRIIARMVYRYWYRWTMKRANPDLGLYNMYPIAVQLAKVEPNGKCEVIER